MSVLAYTLSSIPYPVSFTSYTFTFLGHLADTCQKKEKQQYISVSTVRIFIEQVPSSNNN